MAIPAFIAANPGLSLSVVSLLGKLGSGILGRNDAKDAMTKAEEENRKIMAQANLRQSFGGNPSVERVQPKLDPGFGTTLLSKLGDAAGLASQAYGLYDAKKLRDLQKLNVEGQMGSRTQADDIIRGATMGAGSILPKTDTIKLDPGALSKLPAGPTGTARLGADPIIELGGSVAPPSLSDVGQAAFSAAQNERIASRAAAQRAAQRAAEDRLRLNQLDEAKLQKLLAEAGKITAETGKLTTETAALKPKKLDYKRIDSEIKIGTPMMVSAAANGTPWDDVLTNQVIMQFDPNTIPSLQALYLNEQGTILAKQNAGLADFLYKDLRSKFAADPFIKKSGDLKFGMGLLAKGYNQQNGAGDLMMINAMVRLSDPGVSVRPMEAEQMEQVGGELAKLGLIATGEKWLDGDKFMPHIREKLIKAGTELYDGSAEVINEALLREAAAATIPVLNLTGKQDINQVPALAKYLDTYRLPPLSIYGIKSGIGSVLGRGIDYSKRKQFE